MTVFLKGLKLGGFKGIGKPQPMAPFGRFNFFAGANNSGKSTVLEFLDRFGTNLVSTEGKVINISDLDRHTGTSDTQFEVALGLPSHEVKKQISSLFLKFSAEIGLGADHILFEHFIRSSQIVWFTRNGIGQDNYKFFNQFIAKDIPHLLPDFVWRIIWSNLTDQNGGNLQQNWIPETLQVFDKQFSFALPKIHLLPSIRQIGKAGQSFKGLGGEGLIDKLQSLQNPPPLEQERKKQFESINRLLRTVLNKPDARIEIPHTKECVIVHVDNKSLPLESLGTGIEEIILIGAYCTIYDGSIMCLEEPELHLHPILQRQLLQYLETETTSQYFISTHSAAFIDMAGGQIFHVENDGASTTINNVSARASRRLLTDRLGYRASDIVQANSIVWVEGPSDRVYLLNWLKQVDDTLVEGIHFSIMFYGGRLLSHLSGDDELIEDFINLKAMNQNSAIVLDSDRAKKGARIGEHKKRVIEEFESGGGFAWLTQGREIENYLVADQLLETIKVIHPKSFGESCGMDQYDNGLKFEAKLNAGERTADKVKVAQKICETALALDVLDLRKKATQLVEFIRDANTN